MFYFFCQFLVFPQSKGLPVLISYTYCDLFSLNANAPKLTYFLLLFRTSPSEFVIPLSKYRKSVHFTQVSVGMRFRMVFETEESTLRRCPTTYDHVSLPTLLLHSDFLLSLFSFLYLTKVYGNCNGNWGFKSKPLAWIKMAQC